MPRRRLGRELRQLRESAQLTIEAVTREMEWSRQKVWRIERGETVMRALDTEAMCKLYGASPEVTEALAALAKETKAKGWWLSYFDTIPRSMEIFPSFEAVASRVITYQAELVPVLGQTRAYAQSVLDLSGWGPVELQRILDVRLRRQQLLDKVEAKNIWILNEAVIRRPVGGPHVMAGQLRHLAEIGVRGNLAVRILPFAAGAHSAMGGPFTILEFPKTGEIPLCVVECASGDLFLDRERELEPYRAQYAHLDRLALSEDDSRELLFAAAIDYEGATQARLPQLG